MITKCPLDIDEMFRSIRKAVKGFPKATIFELADDGYDSPFEQLIACIISIRTYDEVSVVVARRLFERARCRNKTVVTSLYSSPHSTLLLLAAKPYIHFSRLSMPYRDASSTATISFSL